MSKHRSIYSDWVPAGLFLLFLFIFFRATLPAWWEADRLQAEKWKFQSKSMAYNKNIQQLRAEKKALQTDPFYNERFYRILFGEVPQR